MKPVRTTTRSFDAAGVGNGRIMRIVVLWKLLSLGGLGRNPRLVQIAGLGLRHRFGRQYAVITVKHERRWMNFLRGFRRRRATLFKRAGLIRDKLMGRL